MVANWVESGPGLTIVTARSPASGIVEVVVVAAAVDVVVVPLELAEVEVGTIVVSSELAEQAAASRLTTMSTSRPLMSFICSSPSSTRQAIPPGLGIDDLRTRGTRNPLLCRTHTALDTPLRAG
jgi:hypothetical protein